MFVVCKVGEHGVLVFFNCGGHLSTIKKLISIK